MKDKVQKAFETLKQAMIEDGGDTGSYAHSWHCNIAMMCYDAIRNNESLEPGCLAHEDAHKVANEAASQFMSLCFDVDTKG